MKNINSILTSLTYFISSYFQENNDMQLIIFWLACCCFYHNIYPKDLDSLLYYLVSETLIVIPLLTRINNNVAIQFLIVILTLILLIYWKSTGNIKPWFIVINTVGFFFVIFNLSYRNTIAFCFYLLSGHHTIHSIRYILRSLSLTFISLDKRKSLKFH